LQNKYATADAVEKARNARDTAVAAVKAAQAQVSAAEFAVQDVAPLQAKLKAAEAALAEAELNLKDCTVRAPIRRSRRGFEHFRGSLCPHSD
jgi:HlyD family secretion protein